MKRLPCAKEGIFASLVLFGSIFLPFIPLRSMRKILSIVFVVGLIALVFTLEARRQQAQKQLEQLTVRLEQLQTGNTSQNREAARKVIEQVKAHMQISTEVEPTVATIVNVEELRKRNPFYNKAENGDHLIVTTDRAILYDSDKDIILDVIPVQLQPAAPAPGAQTSSAKK